MDTQASTGSLAAIGSATKAFVLAHPLGMSAVGGALLGATAFYYVTKTFKKQPATATPATAAQEAPAA